MRALTALLALIFLVGCSPAAPDSRWVLLADQSDLSFLSIKSGEIAEVHGFGEISGSVDRDGAAQLVIELDSVATGIAIRDERIREHLFETPRYPQARFTTRLEPAQFAGLMLGDRLTVTLAGELSLHGMTLPVETPVRVTKIAQDRILVESAQPVLLDARDFGLGDGLAVLQDLAGLTDLSPAVPVSLSLVFERE